MSLFLFLLLELIYIFMKIQWHSISCWESILHFHYPDDHAKNWAILSFIICIYESKRMFLYIYSFYMYITISIKIQIWHITLKLWCQTYRVEELMLPFSFLSLYLLFRHLFSLFPSNTFQIDRCVSVVFLLFSFQWKFDCELCGSFVWYVI